MSKNCLLTISSVFFAFCLSHASEVFHGLSGSFTIARISETCPQSFVEWKAERENLRNAKDTIDIYAFGKLLEKCSSNYTEHPEQKKFFENTEFNACMDRIKVISKVAITDDNSLSPPTQLMTPQMPLPPNADKLPPIFQDPAFWEELNHSAPENIKEVIKKIKTENPKSTTFSFGSRFIGEEHPTFITIYPTDYGIKYVHYDSEMTILFISKIEKDKDGDSLKKAEYVIGNYTDVDGRAISGNTNSKQSSIKKEAILVSKLHAGPDTSVSNCVQCHQGSIIVRVEPTPGTKIKTLSYDDAIKDENVLQWFQETQVKASSIGYAELVKFLPALGDTSSKMSAEMIKSCSDLKDPKSIQKVISSMNCVKCHDEKGKSDPLKFPFGFEAQNTEVRKNDESRNFQDAIIKAPQEDFFDPLKAVLDIVIDNGHMPPPKNPKENKRNDLSTEERKALKDCLMTEYLGQMYPEAQKRNIKKEGLLIKALLEKPCPQ